MQQTRSTLPGLLLALVAVSAWGLSYIATEWLYTQGLGPFAVLTIRTFLAYAVLLILSHKQFLADELIDEAKFALLGVACIPFYHGLENLALQETNAGTVATIMASAPLFTAFVVIALHHSFRLHWMTKLGIVTVATGMCLIWCTLLWQRAAREAGAQQIRNLLFLIPVIAMIAGLVILDESVTFIGVMGAAMILCGVWCSDLGMKRVNAVLAGADADALSAKFTLF